VKQLSLAVLLVGAAMRAAAADFTDIWYNPLQPGYGYNIVQSDDGGGHPFIFVTFFIFDSNNNPTWYTAELTWNGVDAFTGGVYKSRGTFFGSPWKPAENSIAAVGNATFRPSASNNYQGLFAYTVTGVGSASHSLARQTLTVNATGGSYTGSQAGTYSGCTAAAQNSSYTDFHSLVITHNPSGNVTYAFTYKSGVSCTLAGTYEQHGRYYLIPNAAYTCSDGLATTATVKEIKVTVYGIEGFISAPAVGGGCTENAAFTGVLDR